METTTVPPVLGTTLPDKWIDADASVFRENFERKSFDVSHHLASHPLFQLPQLMELAERTLKTRPADLYYDMGDVAPGQKWNDTNRAFSPLNALQQLEDSNAWFIFRGPQQDPAYVELYTHAIAEIKGMVGGDIESAIKREDLIIFVTSPKRVTAYHIDRECNFILQIHGQKDLYVFDREDRQVLPEVELERFWTIDHNAPNYRPELQDRAKTYRLAPGNGVHVPVNCPHWLKNGDNISVTLSVNFQFLNTLRADVYRANHYLRKLGINPTPPGQSAVLDRAKAAAFSAVNAARRVAKSALQGGD
ncbi:transcriptional regulator [Paraburkholderia sp. CNPSo 3274]|uniref:transcriptional regulator n=1 Tax=Paraburkholderia sp. CNPSo 3274 TaxID=2940932 RepID=UPI0020B89CB6|nr:transcriptional regulator [Paraburkholderia sp. CNPSo 3274]MCP3709192.1 transcriptional regulator [Paraburkholderia sp. CNPSo 3274]